MKSLVRFSQIFGTVYSVKTIIGLLFGLLSKKKLAVKSLLLSLDSVQLSGFIATLSAVYQALRPHPILAGLVSSLALILDTNQSRRQTLIANLMVRTGHALSRYILYSPHHLTPAVDKIKSDSKEEKEEGDAKNSHEKKSFDESHIRPCLTNHPSIIVRSLARVAHACGDNILYACLSYHICYCAFADQDWLASSYKSSLIFATGNIARYGRKHAAHLTRTCGTISKAITTMPVEMQKMAPCVIPNSATDSKSYLSELITKTRRNDPHIPTILKPIINSLDPLVELIPEGVKHSRLACMVVHPAEPFCYQSQFRIFTLGSMGLFRVYMAINGGFALYSLIKHYVSKKHKDSTAHPAHHAFHVIKKAVLNSVQSAISIGVFVSTLQGTACYMRSILGREYDRSYSLGGVIGSLSVLIDKPGRLTELNNYCGAQAILGCLSYLKTQRHWVPSRWMEMVAFSITWTTLTAIYETHDSAVHGFMQPLLAQILGKKK